MKYLILLCGMVVFSSFSQETIKKCGSHLKEQELWKKNPKLKKAYFDLQNRASQKTKQYDTIFTIPIVFHVIHEYGNENISDEQIYRQVQILNEDFRKLNADTSLIVSAFDTIASDIGIEFKLATIDPFGNCTNGIDRFYSNETNVGDDYSKIFQWPRGRYLNVWVVKSMENGVAGYAYFPSSVEGNQRFRDGIIIRHNFIGDIGTSNPTNSRALTHEVGHYLGLSHTWGPTNDPAMTSNCSADDGIDDTPNTIGWTSCDLSGETCGSLDNVQNYMDYSYCSNMFTNGQAEFMRNVIKLNVGQRSNLWKEENLQMSIPPQAPCDPIADFFSDRQFVCENQVVQFQDFSWRLSSPNVNYSWTFEDANVSTSTDKNPGVIFNTPGWKEVSLTIENEGRTSSVIKSNFIYVSPDWSSYAGAHQFSFETNEPNWWMIQNKYNDESIWQILPDAGTNNSGGIYLKSTTPYQNAGQYSPESYYKNRRGGVVDAFISPAIDLEYSTNLSISFDYACATNATNIEDMNEKLIVYTSTNCGQTWIPRKTLDKMNLINNGTGWDSFYPGSGTTWSTASFQLPDNFGNQVFLKFEYVASDLSNNIAIDNININGLLLSENFESTPKFTVYPNPTTGEEGWRIKYDAGLYKGSKVNVVDYSGQKVLKEFTLDSSGKMTITPEKLSSGLYYLSIITENNIVYEKLIVQ